MRAGPSRAEFEREVRRLLNRIRLLRAAESGDAAVRRVRVRGYRVPGHRVRAHWRLVRM